ncbi:hypothetical protein [Roseibium salinum]|uniref:DUF1127 domain-containing protein n=1 Tax=Roseibium salinum TaxID=1604349 RepID=A0ABT3R687_9HYPH|nr:hypothetical protein [Roseibium sp. DSM 29163]MCX2724797.1 hypothetical protein [Roseibium sp. DSM 29163]MDN3721238.1 hypothetical protein [Roseibium salinum]
MAFDLLSGFFRDIRAARRVASEIERMNYMSDAQLSDLGLERNQIASRAFNRHFKRR